MVRIGCRHRGPFLPAVLAGCLLLAACGGEAGLSSPTTGSLTVHVQWPASAAPAGTAPLAVGPRIAPLNVVSIVATVTGPGMSPLQQTFAATPGAAGSGTISGIPVGSGRSIVIEGLDAGSALQYSGSVSGITILGGQTTDSGMVVMGSALVSMAIGYSTACALSGAGLVKCWGWNGEGELGQNNIFNTSDGIRDMTTSGAINLGTGLVAQQIVAGSYHVCALLTGGSVKCWGLNAQGQLGQPIASVPQASCSGGGCVGDTLAHAVSGYAVIDLGLGRTATQLAAAAASTCALLDDASVKCFGDNTSGVLGQSNLTNGAEPSALASIDFGGGHTALQISASNATACAILDDHSLKCWGRNAEGQLGQQSTANVGDGIGQAVSAIPAIDLGLGRTANQVTVGGLHVCALLDDNSAKCWGSNGHGQLGRNNSVSVGNGSGPSVASILPIDFGLGRTVTQLSAGALNTCAILDNRALKCWGYNGFGELGQDDTTDIGTGTGPTIAGMAPVNLGGSHFAKQVLTYQEETCVLLEDDTMRCWGSGGAGQLGQNATSGISDGVGASIPDLPPINTGL